MTTEELLAVTKSTRDTLYRWVAIRHRARSVRPPDMFAAPRSSATRAGYLRALGL